VAIDENELVAQSGFGAHVEHSEMLEQANPEFVEKFKDVIDQIRLSIATPSKPISSRISIDSSCTAC